jgi:ABC-type transporter MlaC component
MRPAGFLFVAVVAALVSLPALARADEGIDDFVEVLDNTVRTVRADGNDGWEQTHAHCRELMGRVLDIDTMARSAVDANWERMTAHQRTAYRAAFESRMANVCVRSMRAFRSQRVILAGVRQGQGGERMATTTFVLENEGERLITWRLRDRHKPLRAVDVIADGRSVVASARSEFSAVLDSNNGDIGALIASMQR